MSSVHAFQISEEGPYKGKFVDLDENHFNSFPVQIRIHYSSVNYKDALAGTGKGKILRTFPCIPGIDLSGEVINSKSSKLKVGQKVLITGCGIGENYDGGYSELACADDSWVIPIPEGLDPKSAMILGTAGFTSGLAIHRFQENGQTPEKGPIVVTGASGGVGGFSVEILSKLGFEVHAMSSKKESHEYLKKLGAKKVILPKDLELGTRPLEKGLYGGAIDNVGGALLSSLTRHINLWGNIACIGLAGGIELNTTVMPMILRGVSLLGISSANCPRPLRDKIWERLAGDLYPSISIKEGFTEFNFKDLPNVFDQLLNRTFAGRALIKIT